MLFDDASKVRSIVEALIIDYASVADRECNLMIADIVPFFIDALAILVNDLGRSRGSDFISEGVILQIDGTRSSSAFFADRE